MQLPSRADTICCGRLYAGFQADGDVKGAVADQLTTQLKTCEVRAADC
jgi:hypothetical protein